MKSHESDLLKVAFCIYKDACAKCTEVTFDVRDLKLLESRTKHEGLSFLTITLPTLDADLLTCLSLGRIESACFRSFRKRGKAPAFLQGFFTQVFEKSGRLKNDPSIEAIEGIRQIACAFKKLKVECTRERVQSAINGYVATELVFSEPLDKADIEAFREVSRHLWPAVLNKVFNPWDLIPKHGPGATADGPKGNQKFVFSRWHHRLEPYFPLADYCFANYSSYQSSEFEAVEMVNWMKEYLVKVIPVPKTLKTPRIIAEEPVCMMYTQQAVARWLIEQIEGSPITGGHINFSDQQVNRDLALDSSRTKKRATIDMKSASDLVHCDTAMYMFEWNQLLAESILACRSNGSVLPDGTVIWPLEKFASMGSALCFPVEAMYFYTICVIALLCKRNLPVSLYNVKSVARDVYVYGDDIIVPTDDSGVVIETLQKYYCRVNTSKSFMTGNFRESCGMDAYNGEEVTPTYIRNTLPDNKGDASRVISIVATSNLLYKKGYWLTATHLKDHIEKILGPLPIVMDESPMLGWTSYQEGYTIHRINRKTHAPEVRSYTQSPIYSSDHLEGEPALLKCLMMLENRNYGDQVDEQHLERSPRHGAVALKRRWGSPF